MDQRHSIPAFHPGRLYQIGEDSWYLDAGGNWFLWDISSENWVLSGQAESAIPNSAALARHTANANAASATGYASGTSSFGGRPEPASMDQATGQPVYRGAHSTPQRLQTLLRNPMVDSVDDMNVVAIPANGALGTGRTIPSTIAVNGGSWDSMIEDNLPPRTDVRGEPHGRRPSDRNQLMDRDDRVNDFVRTQIRSGITTRNPYEAPHSLSLVDERILQDQRHGRSSRSPEYRYATNLTVSSDGSTSESETPNDRPKSVSKSQRERKSDKGSSSRRGRR